MREKPAGFSSPATGADGVKRITAIDAEVVDDADEDGAPSSKVC